jgi:hypothetical protein
VEVAIFFIMPGEKFEQCACVKLDVRIGGH